MSARRQGSIVRDENGLPMGCYLYVRVPRSRRKLDRFVSFLGRKPQFLYSFHFHGNFVYVSAEEYGRVKQWVTKARVDESKLLQCWG